MGFILNSRPIEHRERFHAAFGAAVGAGWTIVDCPVLTAEPLTVQLPPAGGFDLVLFTSRIAAALFPIASAWEGKKVLAVGEATAATARAEGFSHVIDTGQDVDDMRAYLSRAGFGQALYPSAEDVSADLSLEFAGRIKRLVTYRMIPRAGLDLDVTAPGWRTAPVLAPLFSRRSAESLSGLLTKALADRPPGTDISANMAPNITAVAISQDALVSGPWTATVVADAPTLADMVAATARAAATMTDTRT